MVLIGCHGVDRMVVVVIGCHGVDRMMVVVIGCHGIDGDDGGDRMPWC